jgi:hypothetical protein
MQVNGKHLSMDVASMEGVLNKHDFGQRYGVIIKCMLIGTCLPVLGVTLTFCCSPHLLLLLPLLHFATDPLRLLRTKEVRNVKSAVGMLVNSAKVLSTLTAARALYECASLANGADAQLSNELFVQWTRELVDSMTMHSAGEDA